LAPTPPDPEKEQMSASTSTGAAAATSEPIRGFRIEVPQAGTVPPDLAKLVEAGEPAPEGLTADEARAGEGRR
jgi:hypothetical protein